MADYEFSSAYVDSIVRGLKRSPKFAELDAKLSMGAATLVRNPFSAQWQPAKAFEELGATAVEVLGADAFEALTLSALEERFGPIVLPMIKSTLASKSPAPVLKKLGELIKVAVRGVDIQFQPDGEQGGVLQVSYPRAVAPHIIASWVGVIRFVFKVTSPGQVAKTWQAPHGATLQYFVTW